jgi:hypothetical protein
MYGATLPFIQECAVRLLPLHHFRTTRRPTALFLEAAVISIKLAVGSCHQHTMIFLLQATESTQMSAQR